MSSKEMIQTMAELVTIHQELMNVAVEKTALITKGEITELEVLIREEGKILQRLQTAETRRSRAVSSWLKVKGTMTENATLSDVFEHVSNEERIVLEKLQKALIQEIEKLHAQNQLNQQLIEDSLRFVNLSLDLLTPDPDDISYKRPQRRDHDQHIKPNQSIFDSKA